MSNAGAMQGSTIDRRPNYGIDSPGMVIGESAIGAIALACAIFFPCSFGHNLRWLEIVGYGRIFRSRRRHAGVQQIRQPYCVEPPLNMATAQHASPAPSAT